MRDDDYIPSVFANDAVSVRRKLAELDRPKRQRPKKVVVCTNIGLRGGVELRDPWERWQEARRGPNPPPSRLRFIMDLCHFTYPDLARAGGINHTSILRLARFGGCPRPGSAAKYRDVILYINRSLECAGWAPITAQDLFPLEQGYHAISRGKYEAFLQAVGI